jgi:hypothetical protein
MERGSARADLVGGAFSYCSAFFYLLPCPLVLAQTEECNNVADPLSLGGNAEPVGQVGNSKVDMLCMTSEDMKPPADRLAIRGQLGGVEPQSSFWMEPMPRFLEKRKLLLMPNRSRKKYSLASLLLSPFTSIVMVFVVSPGAKVSVPALAM